MNSKLANIAALREQLRELGHRECHSCYVCYDDWAFARRQCYDRQHKELSAQLLIAVTDLQLNSLDTNTKGTSKAPSGLNSRRSKNG